MSQLARPGGGGGDLLTDLAVFPPPPESSHPGQLAAVVHPAVLQLRGGGIKQRTNLVFKMLATNAKIIPDHN